jgi:NADP-dependent 3-hydroxy acid dehydrogenase YdfG
MSGALSGKTVMVLGGSGSYGAAASRALGREGANVALGGRDRQRLEELSRELSSDGIHTAEVRLDTRQARDPEECSNTIVHALKDPASPDDEPCTYRP